MDKRRTTFGSDIDELHGDPGTTCTSGLQLVRGNDSKGSASFDDELSVAPPSSNSTFPRAGGARKKLGGNRPKGMKPKRSVSWAHVRMAHDDEASSHRSDLDAVLQHYGLDKKKDGESEHADGLFMPKRRYPSNTEHSHRLAAFGISLSSAVSDVILVYPCLVLRRQCQVSNMGRRYHFTPFTIIGIAVSLQRSQGVTCLWKGVGSHLMINALSFGVESGLSEMSTKLPREVDSHSRMKDVFGHIILKALSAAVILPLFSAHLVESIQSDKASDTPGLFFFITEGISRLLGLAGVQSPRMLPFRRLLIPTVFYFLLKYLLSSTLQYAILSAFRFRDRRKHEIALSNAHPFSPTEAAYMSVPGSSSQPQTQPGKPTSNLATAQQQELLSTFISQLVTDVLLYPYETILYRLHVQGTRTIIDDMDRGSGFLPVNSRYEGYFDCFSTAKNYEGSGGLYRGFGALVLQYTMKFSIVKLMHFALKFTSGNT